MNELVIIEEAKKSFSQATALIVSSLISRKIATDLFDAIRAFRKQSEAKKEEVIRPLKSAWEDAKKPFDEFKRECEVHETALQQKMSEWDRGQDRLAKIEQDKLNAKTAKQNERIMARAEVSGLEPVLKVAPIIQSPLRTVLTQAGTKQTRTEKTVYGIKDCLDIGVNASNPKVAELLAKYPALFELNWVAFRKLASTGMLDGITCVEKRTDYVYYQR